MPLQKDTVPVPPKLWTSSVPHRGVGPLLQKAWISPVLWKSWGTAPPRPWTASALQNSPAIKCRFWQWFWNACLTMGGFCVYCMGLQIINNSLKSLYDFYNFLLHCKLFIWFLETLTFFYTEQCFLTMPLAVQVRLKMCVLTSFWAQVSILVFNTLVFLDNSKLG